MLSEAPFVKPGPTSALRPTPTATDWRSSTRRVGALGEDTTVALVIRHLLERGTDSGQNEPPVVVSVSTSHAVDDVAHDFGVPVLRTAVGEINVVERMLEVGANIGGEGNGGVILPAVTPGRDSLVGMALVLEAQARHGGPLSALHGQLPRYAIVKTRDRLPRATRRSGASRRSSSFRRRRWRHQASRRN